MRTGDLVRFREKHQPWDWKIGLLVEYYTWEKIASILCEGEILRVAAANVQLYKRGSQCKSTGQISLGSD